VPANGFSEPYADSVHDGPTGESSGAEPPAGPTTD